MLVVLLFLCCGNCFMLTAAETASENVEVYSSEVETIKDNPALPVISSRDSNIFPIEPETGSPIPECPACSNNPADTESVNVADVVYISLADDVKDNPALPDISTLESNSSPVSPKTGIVAPEHPGCEMNPTITCADSEILDECPSYCPSDYCPTGDGQNQRCSQPDPCPSPICKCRFNYRRAQNGTCIPTRSCPPFECTKPNEVYNPCPPICPNGKCSQATPTGKCPLLGRIGIILECRPACTCKTGYWRLDNGTCVPYNQCPGKLTCGANEVVDDCPSDCNSDKCSSVDEPKKLCAKPCQCPPPACRCAPNYRRDDNGKCIPEKECPGKLKCAPGEVVDNCPVLCNTDYCPKNDRDVRTCYTPIRCMKPACRCPFNHLRAKNGTCIPASSCPPIKCRRPHEVYNSCPPACPTDDCKDASPSGECKMPGRIGIVVECRPGCRCEEGYWRQNGTCVPLGQCDPMRCVGTNEYLSCVNECPPPRTCKNREIKFKCTVESQEYCRVNCVCKKDFYRNSNGKCVRAEYCDN